MLSSAEITQMRADAETAANATLVNVRDAAQAEDYDFDATDDPPRWTGVQPVYYSENRERVETARAGGGEATDVRVTRRLTLFSEPIELRDGDRLTITFRDDTIQGTVRAIARRTVCTVVELEDT